MKLREMEALPKTAGDVARLHFFKVNGQIQLPHLRGRNIFLPNSINNEFHPLRNGEQFLFLSRSQGQHLFDCYFGGTDERSAFLANLHGSYLFRVFQTKGERAFFNWLKPGLIRKYERLFRTKSERRRDVYAVQIPDWQEYQQSWFTVFGFDLKLKPVKLHRLFYSRQRITGSFTIGSTRKAIQRAIGSPRARVGFGRGVLEHPQHSPLELDSVHLIMQSWLAD